MARAITVRLRLFINQLLLSALSNMTTGSEVEPVFGSFPDWTTSLRTSRAVAYQHWDPTVVFHSSPIASQEVLFL